MISSKFLKSNLSKILTLSREYLVYPVRLAQTSTSVCGVIAPHRRPCFDLSKVRLEHAHTHHAKMIRSFLYNNFWPREPSVVGLWMTLTSPYLDLLTDRYSNSGDRLLAFEVLPRTGEKKLVGLSVGNRISAWAAEELQQWALVTDSLPEKHRMHFCAHCLVKPDLIRKYGVDHLYEVEVVATEPEVGGRGLGARLLLAGLRVAFEHQHPLVQVTATSHYTAKMCEKCSMKRVWSMDYLEFIDPSTSRNVFYPRRPHSAVAVYVMTSAEFASAQRARRCQDLLST